MPQAVKVLFYKFLMILTRLVMALLPDMKPMVILGSGSSLRLADTIGQFGLKKVQIVTDKMLVELGMIDSVTERLKAQGIETIVFDGVEPDPSFEVVEAGLNSLKQQHCDAVLAIGGGSSIDAAKVMALAAGSNKTPRELLNRWARRKQALPLFAIPTTAGTGSEVTVAAVISDPQMGRKKLIADPKMVPLAAALDPDLMAGMPPHITAATGMDALTHAIEAYISDFASASTDVYALAAVRLIMENLEQAYNHGDNRSAREAMALAAFYAGQAFTKAFVGYVHAIAHQFGARYHTPHGLANALVLPHILEFSKDKVAKRLAELAVECGLGQGHEEQNLLAQRFIDQVRSLNDSVGIPETLEDLQADDIPALAEAALQEGNHTYPVPKYMEMDECQALLQKLLPV